MGLTERSSEERSETDKSDLTDASTRESQAEGVDTSSETRHQRIRQRAYDLWEREGRQDGTLEKRWHDAVREIDDEDGRSND
ncbi:hypothetical protein C7I84_05990 [Mesorhizobium ephedrae]|uniref:DUF2934 domain-containing protein n=2 Tax=Kumtagia ephedrae TaxID=2116701 RepID=A0A2P7SPU4_9HYPH|nr:hypothetical protein C7I84_05990 [Mesorhizobium ephedrae]